MLKWDREFFYMDLNNLRCPLGLDCEAEVAELDSRRYLGQSNQNSF